MKKHSTRCHRPSNANTVFLNLGFSPITKQINEMKLKIKNIDKIYPSIISPLLNSKSAINIGAN